MKKTKIIIALLALVPFSRAFAQVGEIIYVDFEPDTALHVGSQAPHEIWIDFDNDELPDLRTFWYNHSPGVMVELASRDSNVMMSKAKEGDTIPLLTEWWTDTFYPHLHENYAIRIEKDGNYYYGWFRTYTVYEPFEVNDFCFDKYAFCTIPSYPLRWGQTKYVGIEENEANSVNLHPNPTSGIVHIEGVEATEVQVFNTIGQLVKTIQNTNEVSLEGLPQGVYLLRVTTEDGKVFSEKVVKE